MRRAGPSISSTGAVLDPRGLLLTCHATIQTSFDRLIAAHVLGATATGPKIFGCLPLPCDDMARRLVENWNPTYKLLDYPKMHASIARMLGVQNATRVRGVPNAAMKAKLIRVRLPPADTPSVL